MVPVSSLTPPARSRDTQTTRPSSPSPPTQPQQHHIQPQPTTLSTSEPSLRFPRPQGNRHLANWISSSNPDIMRLTTTPIEDAGLSESTYELISGTDSESQDGNYTESMGESVGSLDFHRPDDVHSLAGTEHTHDDESVLDETEPSLQRVPTPAVVVESDDEEDHEDHEDHEVTLIEEENAADSESDDDARSRSSLEYTQQSLKAPSIPTPEASKIVERPAAEHPPIPDDSPVQLDKQLTQWWETAAHVRDYIVDAAAPAIPGVVFAALLALLISAFYSPHQQAGLPGASTPGPTIAVTTTTTVTSTSLLTLSTKASSVIRSLSTPSSSGVGLIPLADPVSDDWLFGAKKPDVTFSPRSLGEVLVHVPSAVKETWLSKDCLVVTAARGDNQVQTLTSSVEEGILIKFPKKESHGVVTLTVATTCRPKVQKVVKVHFGKGIMEEAIEMTKNFAQDLSELVPAAAQEAERRFENAKRSFETVSDNLGQNVQSASDKFCDSVGSLFATAQQSFADAKVGAMDTLATAAEQATRNLNSIAEQASQHLPDPAQVQDQLQLGLLNAQISAKLWWLKVTSRSEEHGEYQRKARDFLASKLAEAEAKYAATKAEETKPRPWSRLLGRKAGCHSKTRGRGRHGTHQCIEVV